jgi:hypothetical protein
MNKVEWVLKKKVATLKKQKTLPLALKENKGSYPKNSIVPLSLVE